MRKIDAKTLVIGIGEYLNSYVIPNIDDTFLKITLKTYAVSSSMKAEAYEKIIKEYISNSFIHDFLSVEDDQFDIEILIDSLQTAVNECGDLKITFPAIRFVSPQEKTITFKANDIADFKQVLTNVADRNDALRLRQGQQTVI